MAAEQHNTAIAPCIAPQPGKLFRACDLECIVTPLVHSARLLSMLNAERDGPGMLEARDWLTEFLNDRVEDLRSVLDEHGPRWHTDFDERTRHKLMSDLPTFEEWTEAVRRRREARDRAA